MRVAGPYDPSFLANVRTVHGEVGIRWLRDIPQLLAEIERSWNVDIGQPYALSYNYVAPATDSSGAACVVKLGVPGCSGRDREAAALGGFDGCGAVRLLARDDSRGALLLERADPGRSLATLPPEHDQEATAILVSVMGRLWRKPPAGHDLPQLTEYGADFAKYVRRYGSGGPLPRHLVDRAAELLDQLSATRPRTTLLHGDLHHHNVLRSQREPWLAIDPHGLVGDPGFDLGAMLYNPVTLSTDQLLGLLPARLEQLADLTGLDPDRVLAWGFVMSVLSEVWSSEDHGELWGAPLAVAERLFPRLP